MKTQAPLPSQFALVESRQQSASGLIKDSSEHEQSPSAQGVMSSQIRTGTILRHTPPVRDPHSCRRRSSHASLLRTQCTWTPLSDGADGSR
jgi:hypothetical protein